jgi:hypothetical protein
MTEIVLGAARGFFFGVTDGDRIERIPVFLEGANVDELVERSGERDPRFYLTPVREGIETVAELRAEADRLERAFALEAEIARVVVRKEEPRYLSWTLAAVGFVELGGNLATSEWRLERPGRLPAIVSSRPERIEATARAINLAYVDPAVLSGADGAKPSLALLESLSRFLARLDRPAAEVRRRMELATGRTDLEALP